MAVSGGKRGKQRRRTGAEERLLIVVAGPNGAGKATFVETFLKPTEILVVNPDEVAKGLSPDTPEDVAYEAARLANTWRRDLAARGLVSYGNGVLRSARCEARVSEGMPI